MPFPLGPDVRVQDHGDSDEDLEERFLDLQMRKHECAQAHAHGKSAEHETENMTTPVCECEVGRETVGPVVRFLEQVDRRANFVRFDALLAKLTSLFRDPARGLLFSKIGKPKSADPRNSEKQSIFDAEPKVGQLFSEEARQKPALALIGRRKDQGAQHPIDMIRIERPFGHGIDARRIDHRVERSPQQLRRPVGLRRDVDHRPAASDRHLHDFRSFRRVLAAEGRPKRRSGHRSAQPSRAQP